MWSRLSLISNTLSHFPPLAGRLSTSKNGHVFLSCNDNGADFVFAVANSFHEPCLLTGKLTVERHIQCEAHKLNLESSLLLYMICLTLYIRTEFLISLILGSKKFKLEQVLAMAKLARRCLSLKGKKRPDMRDVSIELEQILSSPEDLDVHIKEEEEETAMEININDSWSVDIIAPASLFDISPKLDAEPLVLQRTW